MKIFAYVIGGVLAMVAAVYSTLLGSLEWHMLPRSWDAQNSDFRTVAVDGLSTVSGGPLPSGVCTSHYYRKNNFNDGDELWRLEISDAKALRQLTDRLRLKAADAENLAPRLAGAFENKPAWIVPPETSTKFFYIDDEQKPEAGAKSFKFGIFYLWSNDGRVFFLYHIIT